MLEKIVQVTTALGGVFSNMEKACELVKKISSEINEEPSDFSVTMSTTEEYMVGKVVSGTIKLVFATVEVAIIIHEKNKPLADYMTPREHLTRTRIIYEFDEVTAKFNKGDYKGAKAAIDEMLNHHM